MKGRYIVTLETMDGVRPLTACEVSEVLDSGLSEMFVVGVLVEEEAILVREHGRGFKVTTDNGTRTWWADDEQHAREQHDEAHGGEPGEEVIQIVEDLEEEAILVREHEPRDALDVVTRGNPIEPIWLDPRTVDDLALGVAP